MTGGRIRRIRRYIEDDLFLVTYGDGLSDVNVPELVAFHKSHGKSATLTTVRPTSRFGVVDLDNNGSVAKFAEKPQTDGWVSAGFFLFNRRIFDLLPDDDCILEREPLEKLAADGQLMAYRHHGFFHAMDTYREYLYLNELWNGGRAPWKVWE
jgi:glucose-1-phosphate cytidylyltransferase